MAKITTFRGEERERGLLPLRYSSDGSSVLWLLTNIYIKRANKVNINKTCKIRVCPSFFISSFNYNFLIFLLIGHEQCTMIHVKHPWLNGLNPQPINGKFVGSIHSRYTQIGKINSISLL